MFISSSLVKLIWVYLYYIVIYKERILYVLIFTCKKQCADNIERSVTVYLLFLFVFIHICIHFENVQIVDESFNHWDVCWKN